MIVAKDHRATETHREHVNRNSDVRRWHIVVMKIMTFLRGPHVCARAMNEWACSLWLNCCCWMLMFLFIEEKPKISFAFRCSLSSERQHAHTQHTSTATTAIKNNKWFHDSVKSKIAMKCTRRHTSRSSTHNRRVCSVFLSPIEFDVIGIIRRYYELPPWPMCVRLT